jgi:hypothetical protein
MSKQSEALRLADALQSVAETKIYFANGGQAVAIQNIFGFKDAITELRRLHKLNGEWIEVLKSIRQWDALDIPNTDGVFWKKQLDEAIAKAEG